MKYTGTWNYIACKYVSTKHIAQKTDLAQVMPECLFNSVSILLQQSAEVPQLMDTVLLRQCLVAAESRTETCNDLRRGGV